MLLRPSGDALAIELLFYPEDVRVSTKEEIEEIVHDTKVAKAELDMAKQLVESLSRPFEPNEFENEHKRDLMALIEKKLAGEEISVAPEPEERQPVPDLMAALQASLEQAKDDKRKGGAKPATSAKKKKAASGNGARPRRRSLLHARARRRRPSTEPTLSPPDPGVTRSSSRPRPLHAGKPLGHAQRLPAEVPVLGHA